jgi:hypothetical protein
MRPCVRPTRTRLWILAALIVAALIVAGLSAPASAQSVTPAPPVPATEADASQKAEAAVAPAEPLIGGGASLTFASAFVWRGFVLTTTPAVQPGAFVTVGPVTVTSWANVDHPVAGQWSFTEHDFTVDYSREAGPVTLSAGWTNYFFATETGRHSNEFYGGIAGGGYLNPALQVYADVQQGHGTYAVLTVSHEYPLSANGVTVTPTASLGYNHHQWTEFVGFSDVNVGARLSWPLPVARLAIQPWINYSFGFKASGLPSRFYVGVSLAVE